jgi:hypothetical protein
MFNISNLKRNTIFELDLVENEISARIKAPELSGAAF